ncbi:MAG: hypothetical protein KatS3mg080_0374 [Anoxybacillus sp.]|nr:MAG: hypothetical protein KatS3mg080_0374 [Anoxybacillus sp.]
MNEMHYVIFLIVNYGNVCARIGNDTSLFLNVSKRYASDVAIEAYLIGAHYSRFIHYGESMETVRRRCIDEYMQLIYELYEHMKEYGEDMYDACARYIDGWWKEGIEKGLRRLRLRLK